MKCQPLTAAEDGVNIPSSAADEYAITIMKNVHDSFKWAFTVLMAGATLTAANTLAETLKLPAKQDSLTIPTLFIVFSLTIFRFYWGWIRYCDVKYVEAPTLIQSLRETFNAQNKLTTYNVALSMAIEYSRLKRIIVDIFPVFFQNAIIVVLAFTLNDMKAFILAYIYLMFFNAIYLIINYNLAAYHQDALRIAFGAAVTQKITPRDKIIVWITNNVACGLALATFRPENSYVFLAGGETVCVYIMLLNSAVDLVFARKMYARRANSLREIIGKYR